MSGIVGIINLDGAPVDQQLLRQMTEFMSYRGPDAQDIWIDGHVGFGHTMLRTTFESEREIQPCSLDGQVWITADARVDDRAGLIQKLGAKGRGDLNTATDVELILHAYHVWGEDCVKYLLGDFAFSIWDGRQQRLFCARDHLGVKMFYYAHVGSCLVFSNTLNCIRRHPAVSDELNDLAIGDFLLFGFNQEMNTTTFADIQRMPPAHYLTWSEGALRLNRYWSLSIERHIRYKRGSDYVDHFKELLRTAVDDRLRTNRVGVFMSGGLDSTALAATAHELLSKRSVPFDLRAFTIVYDRLISDEERYYSGLVAEAAGIPIHYLVADDYTLYERANQPELRWPEPLDEPVLALSVDLFKQVAAHSRVALTGLDGDAVLSESPKSYFGALLKGRRFGRLVSDMGRYVLSQGQLPPIGVRTRLKRLLGMRPRQEPVYPTWLNRAFTTRLDLRARWEQMNEQPLSGHPIRPHAYRILTSPSWPSRFEGYDPGGTLFPVEARHPLVDLRLVNYLLSVPPVPWCVNKELLRVAMHGVLPASVRLRPKASVAGYPYLELLRQPDAQWVDNFDATPELTKYVDRDAVPQVAGEEDPNETWMNLHPLSLNFWLRNLTPANCTSEQEEYHETT